MTNRTVSGHGTARVRLRPWRDAPGVAEISLLPYGTIPPVGLLDEAVAVARADGHVRLVTPALARGEWRPFLDAGFDVHEELHLLVHSLLDVPDRTGPPLRRGLRRDHARVLEIDRVAFSPFWQMDHERLADALDATPSTRFRVDRVATPAGYAIVGRAGDRGYIQRLAVVPEAQGAGLGTALVVDGLHWLRRWRSREVFVNTQVGNASALRLYERLGFRRRADGLAVLELRLDRP